MTKVYIGWLRRTGSASARKQWFPVVETTDEADCPRLLAAARHRLPWSCYATVTSVVLERGLHPTPLDRRRAG
jgi:hypothetical protein